MSDLLKYSLADLARQLKTCDTSAEDLVQEAIANHQANSESLGAFIAWDPDSALKQAKAADAAIAAGVDSGPLQGLPISIKDLLGIEGYPLFAGTPRELPRSWRHEGPVVQQLRRQLSVITGKTHTVEFAFGGLGVNPHWKTPRNPWDSTQYRVPGGSSSGAGVSLCVGSSVLAIGTDTAGSVRIPASMTGNVGLKTSIGRWSTSGIVPLSPSLDTVGLLCRTVDDAIYAFNALDTQLGEDYAGAESYYRELEGLRIGLSDGLLWSDCSPGVVECVSSALDDLAHAGARLISLNLPEPEQVYPIFKKGGLAAPELQMFLKNNLPEWLDLLDETIALRMEDAATLTACEYLERVTVFHKLSAQIQERLRSVDVLVCPTVPITAPTMAEIEDLNRYRECNLLSLRNTGIVNYLKLCALTLPVGLDAEGMPVGMQLIAPFGQDAKLLAIARCIEQCLGTSLDCLGKAPLLQH